MDRRRREDARSGRRSAPSPTSSRRRSGWRAPGCRGETPRRRSRRCRRRGSATSGPARSSPGTAIQLSSRPTIEQRHRGAALARRSERADQEQALVAAAHREGGRADPAERPRVVALHPVGSGQNTAIVRRGLPRYVMQRLSTSRKRSLSRPAARGGSWRALICPRAGRNGQRWAARRARRDRRQAAARLWSSHTVDRRRPRARRAPTTPTPPTICGSPSRIRRRSTCCRDS